MSEFAIWDPPRKYAFPTVDASFPAGFTLESESVEAGRRLISRREVEFKGLLKAVEWLFGRQIEDQVQNDSNALELLLEGD
jgi:hypothetical protein